MVTGAESEIDSVAVAVIVVGEVTTCVRVRDDVCRMVVVRREPLLAGMVSDDPGGVGTVFVVAVVASDTT